MTDTVDKIIIESSAPGAKQATADVQGLSKAMDGVTVASEKTERSSVSLESKFASLERRLHTSSAQAREYEKHQKTINDALSQNPALASRAAEATAALSARYTTMGSAATTAAKATGLTRSELINVSRQLQDIGVQFASGQSPLTILAQQGPQIADVFASSQGTVRGFFEQITTGASRVLTPMRVLAGGVTAIGGAALYIASNWSSAQREIDAALVGIGRRSGETRQSINRFANDNASALGLSVSEARSVAVEFAKTGNIAASSLKGVGDAVKGYSILTGKDAADATKELAGAFSGDLVAAAMKVDSVYGVMTAATLENIRALEAQGQRAQAVQIILDRMAPINQKAADSVGVLSKAWTGLTNILSNVAGGGSLTDQRSPQAAVDDLTRRRDEFPGTAVARNERGELNLFKGGEAEKLAYFNSELARLQPALDAINAENAAAQLDKLSTAAFGIGNAILPQIDAISKLDSAIRQMQEAQSQGVGPSNSEGMIAVLQRHKELQQESLDATIRQAQYVQQLQAAWGGVGASTAVALASLRDQLNVAQQVTGAGQMRAQQQATVNSLLREGKDLEEASSIALEQKAVAEATATANVEKQTQALRDQNEMIKARQNGTEATTAAAIAYRSAIESGADATAAAALKAETLKNYMLQAAGAANEVAQEMDQVAAANLSALRADDAAHDARFASASDDPNMYAGGDSGGYARGTSEFAPRTMTQSGWFPTDAISWGRLLTPRVNGAPNVWDLAAANQERRRRAILDPDPVDFSGLQSAIRENSAATEKNTAALNTVTLNPLYTHGRGALQLGYMGAAKGVDFMVQGGVPGVDSVPIHIMAQQGERVQVTPAGQVSNDNSKSSVVNATINIVGSQSTSRRNSRQLGQKYASMLAALS